MIIEIDRRCGIPASQQVADAIAWRILAGVLAPGRTLPAVKELARQLRLNPRVVEQAYGHLTELGLARERAGEERVATAPPAEAVAALSGDLLSRSLQRVVSQAQRLGLSAETVGAKFAETVRATYELQG